MICLGDLLLEFAVMPIADLFVDLIPSDFP